MVRNMKNTQVTISNPVKKSQNNNLLSRLFYAVKLMGFLPSVLILFLESKVVHAFCRVKLILGAIALTYTF